MLGYFVSVRYITFIHYNSDYLRLGIANVANHNVIQNVIQWVSRVLEWKQITVLVTRCTCGRAIK